jgi:hypothetical protein
MLHQQTHQAVALNTISGMLAGVANSTCTPADLHDAWKTFHLFV